MNRRQHKKHHMAARRAVPAVQPSSAAAPAGFRVTAEDVAVFRAKPSTKKSTTTEIFKPYEPIKGVLPAGNTGAKLAMDAGFDAGAAANLGQLDNANAAFGEGYAFPGFTVLANWAQAPEFRRPAEVFAREMTRKWLSIVATGEQDKSEKVKKIEAEFKRLNVKGKFREAIEQDGLFGRSQIFIDVGMESDQFDPAELKTELSETKEKVAHVPIRRLTVIEPIWSYPNRYNANDPLDPTYYKPTTWFVMGKEIHSSRLMTIITREVPDILKPAYAFSGLSLSQMIKPYVDNWLRTRQSVSDLIHSFTVWTLKTDMTQMLNAGGAQNFFNRMQLFNLGRDNHGVNAISKDNEDFSNVSVPLGGLDKLQAQAQEQQCAPTGIPLVYMTGITPAGLNASSQDEIEVFHDNTEANQEIYTPFVSKVLNLVQLSLFGEIDPEIGFQWEPLKVVTTEQKSTIRKNNAETDATLIGAGIITAEESRRRIAGEEDSPYHGLDLTEAPPDVPEPEMGPLARAEKLSGQQDDPDGEEGDAGHALVK